MSPSRPSSRRIRTHRAVLPLLFGLLVVVGVFTFGPTIAGSHDTELSPEGTAPGWTFPRSDGSFLRHTDLAGDVVVLNFWATWCPPCRKEIPEFIELSREFADEGVTFVGVSLDEKGWEAVRPFVRQEQIPYPIVLGTASGVEAFGGIRAIPVTLLIDREGTIADRMVGYTSREELKAKIEQVL
jgi:cytochrome c biogenesis protein CcmG/thiol:disulfide interchange protein DsbE